MPTQMGSTAAPFTSLRMTIGMLVTGSIIKPRIFISTSIAPSLGSLQGRSRLRPAPDPFAHQAIRPRGGHSNGHVSASPCRLTWEIHYTVARGPADGLAQPGLETFHQHFEFLADEPAIALELDLALALLKDRQASSLLQVRHVIGPTQRQGLWAGRIFERKYLVVADLVEERERLAEILFGFARESYDHIRRNADSTAGTPDAMDFF